MRLWIKSFIFGFLAFLLTLFLFRVLSGHPLLLLMLGALTVISYLTVSFHDYFLRKGGK
ncbi:MAG: hypothetical protein IJD65_02690 [Mailhella sp.]|nr:hypothetical protein [Mailhella sp.]MBQ4076575.1 hypothetical protein [Mailhella sp.]